jgi:hypothetical protein
MTDQEFDQLFDNGESILETLDLSTAHRINCPTDLMTNQQIAEELLSVLVNSENHNPETVRTDVEKAYRDFYGHYPIIDMSTNDYDAATWVSFKEGYEAGQKND